MAEESLALYRTLGEAARWYEGAALHSLAYLREHMNDPEGSRRLYAEALAAWRDVGDPWGLALAQSGLARHQARSGDREGARQLFEEARCSALSTGDQGQLAWVLWHWSAAEAAWGEPVESARLYSQALSCFAETGDEGSMGTVFQELADLLAASGEDAPSVPFNLVQRMQHAAVLYGAAEIPLRRYGMGWPEDRQQRICQLQAEARARLGADAYASAFAEGQAMTLDAAIDYAESIVQAITTGASVRGGAASPPSPRQAARARYGGLTAREREVAELIAQGLSNREIAAALVLSERTVDTHATNILNKLGYNSRSQIAAWAVRVGLNR